MPAATFSSLRRYGNLKDKNIHNFFLLFFGLKSLTCKSFAACNVCGLGANREHKAPCRNNPIYSNMFLLIKVMKSEIGKKKSWECCTFYNHFWCIYCLFLATGQRRMLIVKLQGRPSRRQATVWWISMRAVPWFRWGRSRYVFYKPLFFKFWD